MLGQVVYGQLRPGINVNGQPVAQGITLHVCKGNSLLYTSSAVNYTSISWQFHLGTPGSSTLPNPPAIVYNTVGADSTIQTVTDGIDTVSFFIKIQVSDIHPVADFTFNNNVCSGTGQQFNPTVSGTAPFQYAWNFDVTGTSTISNPIHTFTSLGCGTINYSNTLTVTDATGCSATVSHPITILQAPDVQVQDPGPIPFSNCQNSPTPEHPNFTLTINNISPSIACITSYTLDWGDGNVISSATFPATHIYTQIGAFNLVVTAQGMNGCSNSVKYVVANQTNPAGSLGTLGTTSNLCAPATVPFTIENWQINSPGTLYQLNFGDGSFITLTHPLNPEFTKDTVYHTYTNSSCPNGSFIATLTVINACGSTPYTAGGITVLKKAVSAFTVSATSFCVGQSVCFNNTTTAGTGPNCTNTSVTTWDFGDGTPTTSVFSPCHTYAAPGIYTVTLSTSNYCGPSTLSMQICVTTPPVPGFSLNSTEGCAPLSIAATNTTTSLNNCTIAKYLWAVTYTSGFCGTASSWNFTNGTTDTSANPSFVFNNAGTYTIILAVTNPCGTFTISKTVSVKQPPLVTLTPVSNTCGTITLTPAATVTACGTITPVYSWTFNGGVPASSSSPNPGPVTFSGAGSHTISLSVTNECGTTNKSEQFIIDTVTIADAGPSQNKCGTSATMAANIPVLGTGSWSFVSGPNIPVFTSPVSSSTTITGLIPGTYVFRWTITNGTCLSSSDVTIVIQPGPTPANAGPDQNLCLATSTNLAANTPTVGTGAWLYVNGPSGYTITDPSSPTTTVIGLVPGVYTFQWTTSFSNCTPSTDNVQLTVYESPTVADAGPNQTVCQTSSITLSGNTPAIGTGLWSYVSGPSGYTITDPSSPSTTVTGLIAGTYIFKWKISNGSCSSSSNVTILIQTGPTTANAGPDQNLCMATSTTLAANTPVIGTGSWSYINGPSGYAITDPSSPSTTVTGLAPGVYIFKWTTSFSSCTPSTDNVQITVYENPTVSDAGSDQTICSPAVTMAANTPVIGSGTWTIVSGPNVPAITTPNLPSTTITGLIPGTYLFKWKITNGVCPASEDMVQVIVNPFPTIANAGTDQIVCATTTIILAGNTPVVGSGTWSYISGPNVPTITTPGSSSTTATGLIPGNYIFQWTITNGVCPPSNDQVQINNLSAVQTQISSPVSSICSGQQVTITGNNPTGGTGIYTYQWQQSNDGTNWSNIPLATSQNYTATLTDSIYIRCLVSSLPCQVNSNVVFIAVQPSVSNNVISANQSICINTAAATITGNLPAGGDGAFTYEWQQSTDGIIWTNIPGAFNADYSPGVLTQTTLYRRIVHTQLCSGPQSNVSVVVTVTVRQDSKALFTANPTISCAQFNLSTAITVTPFPDRNGQYQWLADGSLIGTNSTGVFPGYTMNVPGDTVIIKLITNSQYGCKPDSIQLQFITVTTAIAGFTKTPASGCGPLSVAFTNTSSILNNSIQYFWNFGNGVLVSGMNPGSMSFLNNPNHVDTTYHITLKSYNGCDTTYFRDSVKVFPDSKARFSVDTTRGCSPFTIHILNTSPGNNTAYYWDFGDGSTLTTLSSGPITHTYNTGTISTYIIQLISENQCSRDTQKITTVVSPNEIQAFVAANGNQLSGCAPHTVTFNNSSIGAAQLIWNFGDNSPLVITPNNQSMVSHTYNNGGNYTVTIHLKNDCSDTMILRFITVYDAPRAAFDLNPLRVCTGQPVSVINNSTNANSYEWFWGDGSPSTSIATIHLYNNPGLYNIMLVAKKVNPSGLTCTDTISKVVTVVNKIPAQITVAPGKSCAPYTLNVNAGTISGYSLIKWIVYDSSTSQGQFEVTGMSATHIYNVPGTYSVKLIVYTTPTGCADSTTYQFSVYSTPVTTFGPGLIKTCNHDTVATYSAVTTNNGSDPVNYKWFVNGSIEGTSNPFTYNFHTVLTNPSVAVFNIQALAQNLAGCGDTSLAGKLIIQPLPYPSILVSPSLVIQQPDYTFTFKDTVSSNPNKTYIWYMGDHSLQTKDGREITYAYADTGVYKVKLLVTDFSSGCKATDSVKVTILYIPGFLYVPNAMCLGCSNAGLRQFLPLAKGLKTYHLRIYNGWGQKIFETDKLDASGSPSEPWNGTVNGKTLQQDVYNWQIEATYSNGTEWRGMLFPGSNKAIKAGFITIIK
jgi:PKD repeat protein